MLGTIVSTSQTKEDKIIEAKALHKNAKTYMQKNDFANAAIVYNQMIQLDATNIIYKRELANCYYRQNNYRLAIEVIAPLLKEEDADVETFLTASYIYSTVGFNADARNAINKGIDKYPHAGELYNQKGELFAGLKKYNDAAEAWEKGIEMDPGFAINYYNASSTYFFSKKYIWCIMYGECFINMESTSKKTDAIKTILFESYKQLLSDINYKSLNPKTKIEIEEPKNFEESYLKTFIKVSPLVMGGITMENIGMLRTRFILEWNKRYARKYPLELFDQCQKMLQNGYFEPYNAWLFGRLDDEKNYIAWTQKNANLMNDFDKYFKISRLAPKALQYYHK